MLIFCWSYAVLLAHNILLGVSGGPRGSHEPGIAGIDCDTGEVLFTYEEERFSRYKTSISCFPTQALSRLFREGICSPSDIAETASPGSTYKDMHKRWPEYLKHNFRVDVRHRAHHHQMCHAASSFFASGYERSLIVSLDGVGDKSSGLIAIGDGARITPIRYFLPSESLGFYWAYICQLLGYDGLEDAYKVMGLAPYGQPKYSLNDLLAYNDGVYALNENLIRSHYSVVSKHPSEPIYNDLMPSSLATYQRRIKSDPITNLHMDIASSAQQYLEVTLTDFLNKLYSTYKIKNLCLAGGVALNTHFAGSYQYNCPYDHIYIPPAPGDSGLALGSAYMSFIITRRQRPQSLLTPFLGSSYTNDDVVKAVSNSGYESREASFYEVAQLLSQDKVIALFSGRSELGPRALGNRSIVASPMKSDMKDIINNKIKFRESYRPFAPVVLEEYIEQFFIVGPLNTDYMSGAIHARPIARDIAPAVVHIDGTSRVQTARTGSVIYMILQQFNAITECPLLLNTSFNLKGEPNVESPRDAVRTFASSGLDYLFMQGLLVSKNGFS